MRKGLLIALGLGALAYFLTRELIVGLLVAAASLWLVRTHKPSGPRKSLPPDKAPFSPDPSRHSERATGMQVVCKRVTAERQEWVSLKTGRLFEVLTPNGPPGAKPGDPGEVVSSSDGYRIIMRRWEEH